MKAITQEEFINKAKLVHGDRYDYSETVYIKRRIKVKIFCRRCKEFFYQFSSDHFQGKGCFKCSIDLRAIKKTLTLDKFIKKAKIVTGNRYDYSKVVYVNSDTKICIICLKHGEFWQLPFNHLRGQNCPKCCESNGERKIREFLEQKIVKFEYQKTFEKCKNKIKLRFDFYLPDYNLCIEFDGIQHYKPESFSSDKTEETMIKNLRDIQIKDQIKKQYCLNNNIRFLRIPYWKINNIGEILEKELT